MPGKGLSLDWRIERCLDALSRCPERHLRTFRSGQVKVGRSLVLSLWAWCCPLGSNSGFGPLDGSTVGVMPAHRKPLPEVLRNRPFPRASADALRVTTGVLRGPGVQTLVRGVYLAADIESTLAYELAAFLSVLPANTAVDGVTALHYWGIDIGELKPYRCVTTATYQSKRPEVRVRRARELPESRGSVVRPVPALVAARIDLGLLDLVAAGDWIIRAKLASLAEVQQGLRAASGRHCVRARQAAELVRAGSASPQESRLRLVLVLSGLPEPACNVDLGDDLWFIACVDLYLRGWNIAIEYEGDHHRTDAAAYGKDLNRFEALAAAGVLAIRVSKTHMRRPREVVDRIYAALVSRGLRRPTAHLRTVVGRSLRCDVLRAVSLGRPRIGRCVDAPSRRLKRHLGCLSIVRPDVRTQDSPARAAGCRSRSVGVDHTGADRTVRRLVDEDE